MKKQKERARAERLKKNISGWSEDLFGGLTAEPTGPSPVRVRGSLGWISRTTPRAAVLVQS